MRAQIRTLAEAPETGAVLQELSTGFHAASPQPEANDPVLRHFYETEFLPRLRANLTQPAALDPVWPDASLAGALCGG